MSEQQDHPRQGDRVTVRLLESSTEDMADARTVARDSFDWFEEGQGFRMTDNPSRFALPILSDGSGEKKKQKESDLVMGAAKPGSKLDDLEKAVAIGKEVWNLIKEGKPDYTGSTPSSYVLNQANTQGVDYPDARAFGEGKWYEFEDTNWTGAIMSNFKFQIRGMNRAQAPKRSKIPPGTYIPHVTVGISNLNVRFANWLDVSVALGNPANIGASGDVNAYVELRLSIKSSGYFQTHYFEYAFAVNGREEPRLI